MKKRKGSFQKRFSKFVKDRASLLALGLILLNIVVLFLIWRFPPYLKTVSPQDTKKEDSQRDAFFEGINPSKGYEIKVSYADLGPKMLSMGVIDLDKFKDAYTQSRESLTQEQIDILTKGSNKRIKITRENSHFLLNFFWALGLGNKSKILTEGEMSKNGDTGNFASTGGWPLSKGNSMNYYSKGDLIEMTPDQEGLVNKVASNIYRPCCDNSTAFPDCNHGMALLGVLELMASSGATEQQMYDAAKYINAYWFSTNYYDLAQYFKAKDGKDFKDVDSKLVLSKNYSSASGYMSVKKWLTDKGIIKQPPSKGGSCGV